LSEGDVLLLKTNDLRKLRRLLLALQGRRVLCQADTCSLKATCDTCPLLEVDTRQVRNPLVARYLSHREAA
jgi:hypothetical protein